MKNKTISRRSPSNNSRYILLFTFFILQTNQLFSQREDVTDVCQGESVWYARANGNCSGDPFLYGCHQEITGGKKVDWTTHDTYKITWGSTGTGSIHEWYTTLFTIVTYSDVVRTINIGTCVLKPCDADLVLTTPPAYETGGYYSTSVPITNGVYNSSTYIIAKDNFVVSSGSHIELRANNSIELLPGFHTEDGAKFVAEITPCGGGIYKMNPDDTSSNKTKTQDTTQDTIKNIPPKPVINYTNSLQQNNPNPASTTTDIAYSIKDASSVSITLYNIYGQKVGHLVDALQQDAGTYKITMDASNLAYGVYFYTLEVQGAEDVYKETKRMVVLR